MKQNVLLSYPRSGNHLCRFFIELISEIPTYGCKRNIKDIEIHRNIFDEHVPFNIPDNVDNTDSYFKYHSPPPNHINVQNLILIVRNPKEVLLRHSHSKLSFNIFESYFENIEFYNNYNGKKLLLFYEDIITNKNEFINILYNFLDINNPEKKNYVLSNIDKLYDLSSKGKNRSWGGVVSNNQIDYYYTNIPYLIKEDFDKFINQKLEKYPFLKQKYDI